MKVFHLTTNYHISRVYKSLVTKLSQLKIDNTVYCELNKNKKITEHFDNTIHFRYVHTSFDNLFFYRMHNKIYDDFYSFTQEQGKPDIVHAHMLFSNGYIAYKYFLKTGTPYIVAIRNTDMNIYFKKYIHLRKLGINIMKNAQKVIFISEAYKKVCFHKYVNKRDFEEIEKKTIVIPNGIDDYYLKNSKSHNCDEKLLRIIYAGDINDNKNCITTIKACEYLIQAGYNIQYTIVGKIKHNKFNNILKKDFINYIPPVDKFELLKLYENNDFFVMPSKHETFGLVYAEAMSQGLPLIYTKNQGFDGTFAEGEVGYSVAHNDYKVIAEKILIMKDNYETFSNNCATMSSRFDWEKVARTYLCMYNEIIK